MSPRVVGFLFPEIVSFSRIPIDGPARVWLRSPKALLLEFLFFNPPVTFIKLRLSSDIGFLKDVPVARIVLLFVWRDLLLSATPSWKSFQNLSFSASYILYFSGFNLEFLCYIAMKSESA